MTEGCTTISSSEWRANRTRDDHDRLQRWWDDGVDSRPRFREEMRNPVVWWIGFSSPVIVAIMPSRRALVCTVTGGLTTFWTGLSRLLVLRPFRSQWLQSLDVGGVVVPCSSCLRFCTGHWLQAGPAATVSPRLMGTIRSPFIRIHASRRIPLQCVGGICA